MYSYLLVPRCSYIMGFLFTDIYVLVSMAAVTLEFGCLLGSMVFFY